ncbi:MAG: 4-alpha-glucanotransferase, partial [Bacteroidales bacterium]|nr:4-alpha-glucanotransferase [Bacteroidales bacterium]
MAKKSSRIRIIFRTPALKLRPGETLGITGSCAELGSWVEAVPMQTYGPIFAYADVDVTAEFEYKFVVTDSETGEILLWEEGENRRAKLSGKAVETISAMVLHFSIPSWKGAGTAIPLFSLRSEDGFGIGEFPDLKKLIDWAALTGQKII